MSKIKLFLDEKYASHGINKWISWDIEISPHVLIAGQSGSGKTYASKILLAKISQSFKCEIYVCDMKSDRDFNYLEQSKNFYRYDKCKEGLDIFYQNFIMRQNGKDVTRSKKVLFFDEWSSYCNAGEKKKIEEAKKKLGILVSLGRSFNCHVIISQQRADAMYFNQFRDNFSLAIGMSNLSDESRRMLFPDYASNMQADRKRGTGYMSFNGNEPIPFIVPKIRNRLLVESLIREATSR